MLQNWMYFGLAHGILGVIVKTPVPLRRGFLISRDDDPFINTNRILMIAMVAWKALHERHNDRKASRTLAEVSAVLREAQDIIKAIMLASTQGRIPYLECASEIPNGQRIIISILLLCEQFYTTLVALYGDAFDTGRHISWPVSERLRTIYQKLLECCHSELELIMKAEATPTSFAMFGYALSQTLPRRDHGDCSELECKAGIRQLMAARTCVTYDCACVDAGLDAQAQQQLEPIIKEGHIPMLMVRAVPNGSNTVEAKLELLVHDPRELSTTCIAISHVWADGPGFRSDGRLPSCQLLKLQQHANNIHAELALLGVRTTPTIGF
ncbi:hypothetical protein AMS68_007239 [Peltaster fructicola]|uniref:Uncharacterized protein n=1 Tax=Peltaster fructicola TaxID=286661 RepID=A0A6H0Y3W9_9PEZI|nr:hypothetical protein AMS68_007239 [Peltaster fructicola]